ncbi:MAG: histone deacetylase [Syntrophobacteraceae bacterium]
MRRTGLLYDERFLLHKTGPGHPETPDRLIVLQRALEEAGLLPKLIPIPATPSKMKWIETVHAPKYIYRLEEACILDLGELDSADNQICPQTYETALLAVGGILNAIDMLMEGKIDNAFCAVRPPGHHAETNKALGFCYFNNVAIAARYLQVQWKVGRIGIVDFDVHHGNGTQHIFEEDSEVFYYSIHEHPSFAYPGTGREFEKGSGPGLGTTLNSTVLPGQGDEVYKEKIVQDLMPAFGEFKPEVILVSAGFDAHAEDDMSDTKLSTEGFSWMMQKVFQMAGQYSGGRIISVLEGGYSLAALPELITDHIRILLDLEHSD